MTVKRPRLVLTSCKPSRSITSEQGPLGKSSTRKPSQFFSYKSPIVQHQEKIRTNKQHTRTDFQRFISETPRSSFKKLILSTPKLLGGLHTMSLSKSVPEGLNPCECERTKLCKPPPFPYIPEKDKVQEDVSKLRQLQIKTSLKNRHHSQLRGVAGEWDP